MINEKWVKQYCCEDISKIYGYKEAVEDKTKRWELHHCLGLAWTKEQLIEMGLYYNQPADRLMFVTPSEHKNLHFKLGYNNEEWRNNISNTLKGRTAWNKGVPRPEHLKEKQSKRMSGAGNPNYGKLMSDVTKQKNRNSQKCKKVYQYTKDGVLVNVYESANMAAKQNNIGQGNITNCCLGRCKSYKGYIWSYTPQ